MSARTRQVIGIAIGLASLAMFFWWGVHFEVFGNPIRQSLPFLGFLGWLVLGLFGIGLAKQSWQTGLVYAAGASIFFAIAGLLGTLRRALE